MTSPDDTPLTDAVHLEEHANSRVYRPGKLLEHARKLERDLAHRGRGGVVVPDGWILMPPDWTDEMERVWKNALTFEKAYHAILKLAASKQSAPSSEREVKP